MECVNVSRVWQSHSKKKKKQNIMYTSSKIEYFTTGEYDLRTSKQVTRCRVCVVIRFVYQKIRIIE